MSQPGIKCIRWGCANHEDQRSNDQDSLKSRYLYVPTAKEGKFLCLKEYSLGKLPQTSRVNPQPFPCIYATVGGSRQEKDCLI